jgi:hypothetical protein
MCLYARKTALSRSKFPSKYFIVFYSDQTIILTKIRGIARKLFWKHLFPPFEKQGGREVVPEARHPILYPVSRAKLIDIMFSLIGEDWSQLIYLLRDLDELVPFDNDEDGRLINAPVRTAIAIS